MHIKKSLTHATQERTPMPAVAPEETVLHISASDASPVSIRLQAGQPLTVRLEAAGTCTCQGTGRPGSYTDTDFGKR